jgi:hypothetical protein
LIEVDAFDLCESLSNKLGLVFLNTAVWAPFDAKDPLASNNLPSFGPGDDVVDIELLPSSHLFSTGREPFSGVWAIHGFIIGFWLRSFGISNVGMVTIGGDSIAWVIVRDGRTYCALGMRGRRWG